MDQQLDGSISKAALSLIFIIARCNNSSCLEWVHKEPIVHIKYSIFDDSTDLEYITPFLRLLVCTLDVDEVFFM